MRCEHIVALFVRVFVLAMKDLDPKMLNELRQFDAKLGLSPRSMLDLRWEIEDPPEPEPESNEDHRVFVPNQREENGWHGSDN